MPPLVARVPDCAKAEISAGFEIGSGGPTPMEGWGWSMSWVSEGHRAEEQPPTNRKGSADLARLVALMVLYRTTHIFSLAN